VQWLNANGTIAAIDWFPRIAEELELLEAGERSWRNDAADRLRALIDQPGEIGHSDGDLLAVVALELAGEEDQTAIRQGRVTWRSLRPTSAPSSRLSFAANHELIPPNQRVDLEASPSLTTWPPEEPRRSASASGDCARSAASRSASSPSRASPTLP
jgi:hypothetical protein